MRRRKIGWPGGYDRIRSHDDDDRRRLLHGTSCPPPPTPPPPNVIVVIFNIAITLAPPRSAPTSTPALKIILVLRVILKGVGERDSVAAEAVAAAVAVVVAAAAFKGACLVRLLTFADGGIDSSACF